MLSLKESEAGITSLVFSPDSQTLVSGNKAGTVHSWNTATRKCRSLFQHEKAVTAVAFSPSGRYLASGGEDKQACLIDAKKGMVAKLGSYNNGVSSIAFSPDGKTALVGSGSFNGPLKPGESRVWDLTGIPKREANPLLDFVRKVPEIDGNFALRFGGVWCVAYSPNGRSVAFAMKHVLAIVDPDTWHATEHFTSTQAIRCVAFSQDSRLLAFTSARCAVLAETPRSKLRPLSFTGHKNNVTSVSFTPDGKKLITGSWDGTVKTWRADMSQSSSRKAVQVSEAAETYDWGIGKVTCQAVAPNGMTAAAGGEAGDIVIWDLDAT